MSRLTDDDLRAAFRLRAMGSPDPGLLRRIRQSTRAEGPRGLAVIGGLAHRRQIAARLTAVAAVAAVVALAPVALAQFEALRPDVISDGGRPDQTTTSVIASASADVETDGDADDIGDDEDGIDEDDDVDADDVGDDDHGPEESEDDN